MGASELSYGKEESSKLKLISRGDTANFSKNASKISLYYYPACPDNLGFGMQMPGRNGTVSGAEYRYTFNGMETDKEVSGGGNSYTTQFRQYDPRLGRWKSLDPKKNFFAYSSPYVYAANNPLYYIDPKGGIIEPASTVDKEDYTKAVIESFGANSLATKYLTRFSDDGMTVQTISQQEYDEVMKSLTTPAEKAAFRGLYISANEPEIYYFYSVGEEEVGYQDVDGNYHTISENDIHNRSGLVVVKNFEGKILIFLTKSSANLITPAHGTMLGTPRDYNSMLLGDIVTSSIHYGSTPWNCHVTDYEGNLTLLAVQSENMFLKLSAIYGLYGDVAYTGTSFQYGSGDKYGKYMSGPDLDHVEEIPLKLRYSCEISPDGTWIQIDISGRQPTVTEISEQKKKEKEKKKQEKKEKKAKKKKNKKYKGRYGNVRILQ